MRVAYLDIETDYVGKHQDQRLFEDVGNHKLTVIGLRTLQGEEDSFIQLIDQEISKKNLMRELTRVDRIVTYNGRSQPDAVKGRKGFDFPVIGAQLGIVLDQEFEHLDLVPECWKRGLYGGQKAVEQTLGLRRALPGKDGAWAGETWRQYKKSKDERYLKELLVYNKEDVFMLHEIEEALKKRL